MHAEIYNRLRLDVFSSWSYTKQTILNGLSIVSWIFLWELTTHNLNPGFCSVFFRVL